MTHEIVNGHDSADRTKALAAAAAPDTVNIVRPPSQPAPAAAQGSPDWHRQRLGKVTASRIGDVIARTKSGWGAARGNYLAELACERLTGESADTYTSPAMAWGKAYEDEAKRAYAFRFDRHITDAGFLGHPTIAMSGASPDGLIGDDGLIEIKAPNTATHIETLLAGEVPTKHVPQILWQLACTGRSWCDFVSYDPRLPEAIRLVVIRIPRDDAAIAELEREVVQFLGELDRRIEHVLSAACALHTRAAMQPVPQSDVRTNNTPNAGALPQDTS